MNWLLDANLSYRLVRLLVDLPIQVRHVSRIGIPHPAEDRQLWDWAKTHDYLIVTNDDDFYRFAGALSFPPKVVMLRVGNQSTRALAALLIQHFSVIEELAASSTSGVLELY
jgi:predicted nuclease of predicted toxin-antitoxin system